MHRHVQKLMLQEVLAFRNLKTLHDELVRSKLKLADDNVRGNFPCGRSNCEICKSTVTGGVSAHIYDKEQSF